MSTRTKWMILTPIGLILFSFGLINLTEATYQRRTGQPTQVWVVLGIYSLVLINSGLVIFGEALRFRTMVNIRRETRRSMRQIMRKVNTKSPGKAKSKKAKSPTKTD
ncbi:hypothetical protein [Dyadobacter sandarakinus]|nr:hypothetical protein [Dyadobacter sandarakinus]